MHFLGQITNKIILLITPPNSHKNLHDPRNIVAKTTGLFWIKVKEVLPREVVNSFIASGHCAHPELKGNNLVKFITYIVNCSKI